MKLLTVDTALSAVLSQTAVGCVDSPAFLHIALNMVVKFTVQGRFSAFSCALFKGHRTKIGLKYYSVMQLLHAKSSFP